VQTTVHSALGVKGCVTNGSFRDIDMLAPGFQIVGGRIGPSHAHVHMVQMKCDVTIFGMLARHDDVIHADVHGAVVIPADAVRALPKAIDLLTRREKVILDRARSPGFTSRDMREALSESREIH
jgi:regulator of RNase E activity RraA